MRKIGNERGVIYFFALCFLTGLSCWLSSCMHSFSSLHAFSWIKSKAFLQPSNATKTGEQTCHEIECELKAVCRLSLHFIYTQYLRNIHSPRC